MYPQTRAGAVVEVVSGMEVADPYRWLEGEGPEIEEWLAAQERLYASQRAGWRSHPYFRRVLGDLAGAGGVMAPVTSVPVFRGGRRFFLSRKPGQELPAVMVADGAAAPRILLDPVAFDSSGATVLDAWRPSWSGRLVAFQLSQGGQERPQVRVWDVEKGQETGVVLDPGRPTPVAWLADDSGFFYVTGGPESESRQVRLHRPSPGQQEDLVVFETPFRQLAVTTSPDGQWLAVSCAPGPQSGNVVHLAPMASMDGQANDVGAAHTRKLTAALQHATTPPHPVLLRTEHGIGHGPRAVTRLIELQADTLAFCATHTNLDPPQTPPAG
ncbi:hypothetical protein ACFVJ4_17040 [Streptomyces sp. NPDC127178]|uniref:hypothetical protein n=1 Tax=unclassified Streptomyces TaxID=2593676 RepID=UPI00362B0D2D